MQAHVGGLAAAASAAMGAEAYATGNHVAFRRAMALTLHTAAHEAAHVACSAREQQPAAAARRATRESSVRRRGRRGRPRRDRRAPARGAGRRRDGQAAARCSHREPRGRGGPAAWRRTASRAATGGAPEPGRPGASRRS
ncbi:MAG: DUF4157 domain-containing protein [Kofleriaceae bacterium]|nr:DUF4157 domain-containing protein [Kofleriaceae bacterium]